MNTQCGICGIYHFVPALLVTLSVPLQVCCIMTVAECSKIKPHRDLHVKYIFQSQ